MIKLVSALLSIIFGIQFLAPSALAHQSDPQITTTEYQASREIAALFTRHLQQTGDLAPILGELYVGDFIERYVRQQQETLAEDQRPSPLIHFAPGLEFKSNLLRQATPDEWRRFYVATCNFLYDGIQRGMTKFAKDILGGMELTDIKKTDLYPAKVVSLLNAHPILKNVILKNEHSTPIGTTDEMRSVTATLEQALALTAEERNKGPHEPTEEYKRLVDLMEQAGILKPSVDVLEKDFFGYSPGTRIIQVLTPFMFRLTLINVGGKYKILWAEPFSGD